MADGETAPSENPFDQIDPNDNAPAPAPAPAAAPVAQDNAPAEGAPAAANPFDDLGEVGPGPSTAKGAFARGAEKGIVPAAAGLAGAGAGSAAVVGLGALAGTTVGPWGTVGGAIVGGIVGGYGGSYLQNLAISHLPDSWRDTLGVDDRQARLDETQHGTASFLGGLVPFAVTMRPGAGDLAALPKNATAMQQIMAHPATSRVFGGALNGGVEIAQEKASGQDVDWKKAAISTAFGVVFNRPNTIGETITEAGAHPTRSVFGTPHPTVAQVGDLKIMGPGVTEEVFQGTQEQAPTAEMTAQEHARVEREALGEHQEPDLHGVARQMEPELFAKYDDLIQRHEQFRAWHGEGPGHEMAEKHLAATEAEIREISPTVQAAYRRAEETMGPVAEEPAPFKSFAEMLAARESVVPPTSVKEGYTRLYRGEDKRNEANGGYFTTDREMASDHGNLKYVDMPSADAAFFKMPGMGEIYNLTNYEAGPSKTNWRTKVRDFQPKSGGDDGKIDETPQTKPDGELGIPNGGEAPNPVNGAGPTEGAGVPVPQRSVGEQRASIAADVSQKLIAAGRPEEEAKATGQLIAARYVTRAGRFEGKLGTPEELYAREGAAIAGPNGRAEEPRQVIQRYESAAATAPAPEPVAPEVAERTEPGILSQDFATATQIKGQWRAAAPFKETEPFVQASWHNQRTLGEAGDQIAAALGIRHLNPGIKARTTEDIATIKDEGKRKLAEKARARLEEKAGKTGIGGVTDQVRSGFDVKTPEQADQAIAMLGQKFPVIDEGWRETVGGYFDRKAYVRFPDGMIGEVQFWPPGMIDAKEHRGGHGLYEGVRALPPWHPLIPQFHEVTGKIYADVRAALSPEWKAALGNGGMEPNVLANSAGESSTVSDASAALTSDHLPLDNTQASEGVQKQGSPSSEPAFNFDMGGSPSENVGPHTEPVNAALYISDHVNSLSPAEQKRELPQYSPAAEQAPKGRDQPAGVFMFDPSKLDVDASRFQFKSGGDEYGVTGALRNVTKWDPAKAQAIIVWEQADGKLFVADGHQRAGLARRLTEKGGAKGIELPGILYREKDGISADDIRAMAAVTNIANGSGSALDGAKVLRARPDLMDGSLPLSVGKGKQAAALARLGDEPFRMVVNDVVPEHYGAVVGELIPNDHARQEAALKAIARFEPKNADEAAVLTQRVAQAELAKAEAGSQTSMFGDLETAESTAGEEMKIVGRAIVDLKKDKTLFARVLANAERIEQTGSQIQREAAQGVTSDAELFAKQLTSDAYTAGPIRTELIAAARDLKNGKATIGDATGRILSALRTQAETHGADRAGVVAGEPGAKEYAQNDQDLFEAGAEGKPQQLIPGVAPVTQRDLVQAAANKPMKPKVAQKAVGGLFGDSMDQKELFQNGARLLPALKYNGRVFKGEAGQDHLEIKMPKAIQDDVEGRGLEDVRELPGMETGFVNHKGQFLDHTRAGEYAVDNDLIPEKFIAYHGADYIRRGGLTSDMLPKPSDGEYNQIARGKIRIAEGRRPIIQLMKDANASTFVHESGHQFLEELMKDANHPDAPAGLRDDAQTVRDWLGVTDDIKTKHHEKFARGFEQYVREGVAPSPELAGVFAKFRNWLLSIYQSIKGLGTEISPDIRGVFDRMLEMEPQRTVVAPERASPTLLHDIHEAEAQHIPPHEAEAAHDRVVAESNRHLADQHPEIQNEIQAAVGRVQDVEVRGVPEQEPGAGDIAGKAIPSGPGAQPLVEGRGGPGTEPAGGAGGAEHGAQQPGGAGAGAESADAQRPDTRAKLGDSAGTALAPGPRDLFGDASPYTDRAGNIRLDTLNTSDDVKKAIRAAAAENNDFIGDRRGVVTDGQVMDLANDIGMSGAESLVAQHITGQVFNAEQVVALRKLLRESAANVSAAAKKFATSGADEDVLAFAQAKDRLQMVQKTVAGVTAEAGRALRAFRTLPGEQDTKALEQMVAEATGKTLFQLKQQAKLAAAIDTPQNMNKFMQNVDKPSLGGMLLEGWINGLLSGPSTQVANIVSNAVFAVQHFGPEKAVSALVGGLARAAGREGTYTRLGEVAAAAKGVVQGAAPAALAAGESFKKGATGLLPGEEAPASGILEGVLHDDMRERGTLDPHATVRDIQAAVFATSRGVRDAIVAGGALLKAGGVEGSPFMSTKYDVQGAIPDIQIRGMNVLPVGTAIRSTGRFLATADTFAASLNYSASINGIAYRMASDEGLAGSAFNQRVAQLRNAPTPEMLAEAHGVARATTFMDKSGPLSKAISSFTGLKFDLPGFGETQPLKFVAPFTNVVGRIMDQTIIKRTPLGFLSKELQKDLSGKNGNIAQDNAISRMFLGSLSLLAFGAFAAEGYITGSGPKDANANAEWRRVNPPHSVRIGGTWYAVQKLGPMGALMSMAADFHDVAHLMEEGDFSHVGGLIFHAVIQNTLDQSSMKGPADLIKAIETPDQFGNQYIKSFLSSFVPESGAVNFIARSRDPYIRQAWTVLDAIKAKIPGQSESLHPKIDMWGEPIPSRDQLGGMTGIYTQSAEVDPVNRAMAALGMGKGMPEKKILNVPLTPEQYEFYCRTSGRMAKMRLDALVKSSQFDTFPAFQKMHVINAMIDGSRQAAAGLVQGKWPSILTQARDDKMTLIKTGKKAIH